MLKLLSNTTYKVSRKTDNVTNVDARISKRSVKRINQHVAEKNDSVKSTKKHLDDNAGKMHKELENKMLETAINGRLAGNSPCGPKIKFPRKNRQVNRDTTKLKLSGPVGVAFGTKNINHFNPNEDDDTRYHADPLQVYATCLIAFAELLVSPETEWDSNVLNRVLEEGKTLYRKSLVRNKSGKKRQILRKLNLGKRRMDVDVLNLKVSGARRQGETVCKIGVGLGRFFKSYAHCLCGIEGTYFFIWKNKNSYFVFDCYGRDSKLYRNIETGVACLICVDSTDNMGILLGKMGDVDPNAKYILYPLLMKSKVPTRGASKERVADQRPGYQIIDSKHSTVESELHIDHKQFKIASGKQGLSVAIMGMLYSQIDPPSTWSSPILDKVMLLGFDLYKTCVKYSNTKKLLLRNIPANIKIGQFVATIEIVPSVVRTVWNQVDRLSSEKCTDEIKRQFTEKNRTHILINIGEKSYGVWKHNDHFYVLDPYRTITHKRSNKSSDKNCVVHIFSDLDTLCRTLMSQIIHIPLPSTCLLHAVNIVKVQEGTLKTLSKVDQNLPAVVRSKGMWSSTGRRIKKAKSSNGSVANSECNKRIQILKQLLSNSQNGSRHVLKTANSSSKQSSSSSSSSTDSRSGEHFCEDSMKSQMTSENGSQNSDGSLSNRNIYLCSSYFSEASNRVDNVEANVSSASECNSSWTGSQLKRCKSEINVAKNTQESSDDKKCEFGSMNKSTKSESFPEANTPSPKSVQDSKESFVDKTQNPSDFSDIGSDLDAICQLKTPYYERSVNSHGCHEPNDFENDNSEGSCDRGANIESGLDLAENLYSSTYLYDYKREANPGTLTHCKMMVVVGSVYGSYESLKSLLSAGFKVSDRVYVLTSWRNYVVFELASNYFLYNGCACNPERFRKMDLSAGTAGFLQFMSLNSVISKIRTSKTKNKTYSSCSISNEE